MFFRGILCEKHGGINKAQVFLKILANLGSIRLNIERIELKNELVIFIFTQFQP
jgi:hypothetical protein